MSPCHLVTKNDTCTGSLIFSFGLFGQIRICRYGRTAWDIDDLCFFLIRMGALFGGALGLLGLALALVGVYGVVSYAASQRTQEIGLRMALGASRAEIMRLVLGRGLVLVAIGVFVGLACALSVSHLLTNLLFTVSPVDPMTFIGVPVILGVMALAASYVPAFRATRIDPAIALRGE